MHLTMSNLFCFNTICVQDENFNPVCLRCVQDKNFNPVCLRCVQDKNFNPVCLGCVQDVYFNPVYLRCVQDENFNPVCLRCVQDEYFNPVCLRCGRKSCRWYAARGTELLLSNGLYNKLLLAFSKKSRFRIKFYTVVRSDSGVSGHLLL